MDVSFTSAVVILLLVMDPIGNMPIFVALLADVEPPRRVRIVVRECLIAFGVLLMFVFFGRNILDLLGLTDIALNIAGGVILFLIAVRLIFKHPEGIFGAPDIAGEPFIVPLAIPAIAGPTAIATVILLVSRAPERMLEWVAALAGATVITLVLLLFADRIARLLGPRALAALDRLMGLLLTAIAIEMLLNGIRGFVLQLEAVK
jgi:MarC family membrane protein